MSPDHNMRAKRALFDSKRHSATKSDVFISKFQKILLGRLVLIRLFAIQS